MNGSKFFPDCSRLTSSQLDMMQDACQLRRSELVDAFAYALAAGSCFRTHSNYRRAR